MSDYKIKTSKKIRRQKLIVITLMLIVLIMGTYQVNSYYQNKNDKDNKVYTALIFNESMGQSLEIIKLSKEKGSDSQLFENNNNKIEYSDIKNYKEENLERYSEYHKLHPELLHAEVIWRVNTNLDYPFYESASLIGDPSDYLVVINKYNYLSPYYVPEDLVLMDTKLELYVRSDVNDAFNEMREAIRKVGLDIDVSAAYYNYNTLNTLYYEYVNEYGEDDLSAVVERAGFSEHQSGLSIDINDTKMEYDDFNKTEAYDWIKDNAHRFGFIIRYGSNSEIFGHKQKSYHLRYVTKETAIDMYENNINILEEYLDKNGY